MRYVNFFMPLLLVVSFGLLGCQNGMQSVKNISKATDGGRGGLDIEPTPDFDVEIDFETIEAQSLEAEKAIEEAMAKIAELEGPNGSIRIPLSAGSDVEAELLEIPLNKVFKKVISALKKAREKFDDARAKIEEAKNKLNPSHPAHQALLEKIALLEGKLDMIQAKADQLLEKLAQKIDYILVIIDKYLSRLSPSNPLTAIIYWEVENIKGAIRQFQTDLGSVFN